MEHKKRLDLINKYRQIVWPELMKHYGPDCCIAATRITNRVFSTFRIKTIPLKVRTIVFSPEFANTIAAGEQMPDNPDKVREWCSERNIWTIGIGIDRNGADFKPGTWIGHLVTIFPDDNLMIDASLKQADRPEKGIVLPEALVAEVTNDFIAGKEYWIGSVNGCMLRYEAVPDDHSYRTSPDWYDLNRSKKTTKFLSSKIML